MRVCTLAAMLLLKVLSDKHVSMIQQAHVGRWTKPPSEVSYASKDMLKTSTAAIEQETINIV